MAGIVDCSQGAPGDINADVCVIGSGAAGAILAHQLVSRGATVVVIERGPHKTREAFNQRERAMLSLLWKNAGVQLAANFTVNVAQGSCVGGSTVINDAICFRTPDHVLAWWRDRHKLPWATPDHLAAHFDTLWKKLSVGRVKDGSLNRNNRLMKEGAKELGWKGANNERNCRDCKECGYCHLGCHFDTKQSMLVTYVPWAVEKGVTVLANCAAHTLTASGSRAVELRCVVMRDGAPTSGTVRVRAKAFIVSAGAIGSSELLLRSELGNANVGHSIGFHPSPAVLGRYRDEINAFAGIPMAYHVSEFASTAEKRGFLIEGIFIQPGQFSLLLPSFYPDLMADYAHFTMAGILLHDEQTGVVRLSSDDRAVFFYELSPSDQRRLSEGMTEAARVFLHTDPKPKYVVTSHRRRTVIHGLSELKLIADRGTGPTDLTLGSAHPQGGNRMGGNPEAYAVSPDFRLFLPRGHDTYENLYVCDASVFPTTVGVNPQITVMALALEAAERVAWEGTP